jgi:drug/metabolite transporter (DMT)-like permease
MAAGATLVSFAAVFVKLARVGPTAAVFVKLARVGPTPAGFYRMLVGALVLGAVVVARRDRLWGGRPALYLALLAGGLFSLDLIFWHRSIHYVGPGLSTILANFQVFLLAGFGIVVLRERPSWRLMVAVPLALVGLFLLVGVDWSSLSNTYKAGVAFGLLTAVVYGSFLLALRASQVRPGGLGPMSNLMLVCVVATLLLAVSVVGEGERFAIPDLETGAVLSAYGLTAQVVGWLLISKGIPHLEAGQAGLILLLQPTLAFIWDILFFQRPTDVTDLAGAALALGAIYFGTVRRRRRCQGGEQ